MAARSPSRRSAFAFATAGVSLGLAGCGGPRIAIEAHETFDSTATFARTYAALDAQTCEAARRALLSQGYVINTAGAEQVRGRKSFQPRPDAHVEVEFNVVCATEGSAGKRTIAFVNAVQENYALKKSSNSASLGVTPFGSVSLPFLGSDDSLVKVASVTINSQAFYGRFFQLVERYLEGDRGQPIPLAVEPLVAPPVPLPLPLRNAMPKPAPNALPKPTQPDRPVNAEPAGSASSPASAPA